MGDQGTLSSFHRDIGIPINIQEDYNIVLNFCEMFLGNSGVSRCKDENKLNFCFLVPMELVFEDFIFNFIKNNFANDWPHIP